jgi:hypothetical protein
MARRPERHGEDEMAMARTFGFGMLGAATTMLARRATRRAMHDRRGEPRLPRRTRTSDGVGTMLLLAAAAGALLALGDVLLEQRKQVTQAA